MREDTKILPKVKKNTAPAVAVTEGILEYDGRGGGFLRQRSLTMEKKSSDPKVPRDKIMRHNIREGSIVRGRQSGNRPGEYMLTDVESINGLAPDQWMKVTEFNRRTAIDPHERLTLSASAAEREMRIVDLICPVGKGQRALIVSPPKAGKTMLLQNFAQSIGRNHPEVDLLLLLVDERPEEVTDMRRQIHGEVFASSNDSDREDHTRIAKLILEYAKRKVETGREVVLLIDSLTRMGRAFNSVQPGSGRTMSGGVDIRALEIPKKVFGAARAMEGDGSLTIIATVLIETNSRMDELIFQEFKGTGNMELVLSRDLANERIFPAINIAESGTRREELLFGGDTGRYQTLRRTLNSMKPKDAMLSLRRAIDQYPTNEALLRRFTPERS